ncbi:MAG TPA: hypothetical protein VLV83_05865 [Acidobacteriota bacterium]|nr:hypothetical protein [Acidobacteriota bacterium]
MAFFSRALFWLVMIAVASGVLAEETRKSDEEEPELPEVFSQPIPLYEKALGPFTRPISSSSKEAQQYFDQGFQLMYAFSKQNATRSFREAHKFDPECAICYWGEAWTWGSYLNGKMREEEAPHAYRAIQKALDLKEHASEKERAFIEAMAVRYVEDFDPDEREEQDKAYAEAMGRLAQRYPEDLDAQTLYGEALFLLQPRRGYRDIEDPEIQKIHSIFEKVLEADITHPGACHLYIHATESTVRPDLAEPCAEHLGRAIPGASHIQHMPSHTFNEVGRWGDSVRANLAAWHSDLKAEFDEGVAIYPSHNLHMLLYAASMDGQGAIAVQAGKDYAKLRGDSIYHVLTLVRFGRFDEILELEKQGEHDVTQGMWDFGQGYARLRTGEADFAEVYLRRVRQRAQTSEAEYRRHPARNLLGVAAAILEGEILRQEGDIEAAIKVLEAAVPLEDELEYDEPEPLPFSIRHWLGAALLEASRPADAERVYRQELEDHPHNGWSLYGLLQALEAQGKSSPEVEKDFQASWSRSDTWIRSSRF